MEDDKIYLPHIALGVTLRCTMKCKYCCVYAPYYDPAPHSNYQVLENTIDGLFCIVDYVKKFTLTGGEPLLHIDLPKLIEKAMCYESHFDVLEISTNGTILPTNELVAVLDKYKNKMQILIDNYGEISNKALEFADILKQRDIPFILRKYYGDDVHLGGWIDFGDFTQKSYSSQENKLRFTKCAYSRKSMTFSIRDGEMYPCCRSRRTADIGVVGKADAGCVNIIDPSESIESKRNKVRNLLLAEYWESCTYCLGMCDNSQRVIPAEQLVTKKL